MLHNLSLVEDPTRMLRAVRFEQRFDFRIGKHTLNLIQNAVRLELLHRVEGRRLWHELYMLLEERRPLPAMERLQELGVLPFLHPKVVLTESKRSLFQEAESVIGWYELLYIEEPMNAWGVYLLVLLDHLRDVEVREMLERLGFPSNETERWSERKKEADLRLKDLLMEKNPIPSRVYRVLNGLDMETLLYMVIKTKDHDYRRYLSRFITRHLNVRPLIGGKDLKAFGLKPGPIFRKALDTLRDARLDGKIVTKEDEIQYLRQHIPMITGQDS